MRASFLLLRADLRMLARTRALTALLVAYPLVIALVVGGILLHQGPPRIAFVNEDLTGRSVEIGDATFSLDEYVERAERQGVDVVRLDREEADRALADGQVAGVLVVPQGTMARLRTQLSGVPIEFHTGEGALGTVVAQRMRGVVYQINLRISRSLIETNSEYLQTLVDGGRVNVNGESYDLYGLDPVADDLKDAQEQLEEAEDADPELLERIERAVEFAEDAGSAISLADNALEATAAPIRLQVEQPKGTSPILTAQALAFALAALVSFVCIVLVAASLAAEREDAVLSRLLRGIAHPLQIVVGKLLFGAVLASIVSLGLFVAFASFEPQAWTRLPLLLASVIVASLACGGLGALIAVLVRDARTATLVGILVVLPLVPLMLVGLDGPPAWLVALFPLDVSRTLFNAVLFDTSPWDAVLRGGAHLLAIALVTSALAARLLRRLT